MYNPYNYHIAVRDDAMFFGREKLIAGLIEGLSAPVPFSAAIFGGRRCGKTSLLSKLHRALRVDDLLAAGERQFMPCLLDLQRGRPLSSSDDFFLWVLEELGELWEQRQDLEHGWVVDSLQTCYRDEMARGPVDAFVTAFRSLQKRFNCGRIRLVILIDESEHVLTVEWGDNLRPNLRSLLSSSAIAEDVALVMAGSTEMYAKVTERDSPLENILDRHLLPALSHEAAIALARQPNDNRLTPEIAQEVWRQTGGQPCMVQYLLHGLWKAFDGELGDCVVEDVQDVAETFETRTRHCTDWARTLNPVGNDLYRSLAQMGEPATFGTLRQQFLHLDVSLFQGALDALCYHGLIHSQGRGRRRQYQVAGQLYRDWFKSVDQVVSPELSQEVAEATLSETAANKLQGVQQRINEAQSSWQILTDRIEALKRDLALELGGQRRVVYQAQLDDLETRRDALELELERLKQEL